MGICWSNKRRIKCEIFNDSKRSSARGCHKLSILVSLNESIILSNSIFLLLDDKAIHVPLIRLFFRTSLAIVQYSTTQRGRVLKTLEPKETGSSHNQWVGERRCECKRRVEFVVYAQGRAAAPAARALAVAGAAASRHWHAGVDGGGEHSREHHHRSHRHENSCGGAAAFGD